jgi:hypothetical protein
LRLPVFDGRPLPVYFPHLCENSPKIGIISTIQT